ncbi:MAG: class I SAM-dependent methyltransferase [Candidatus Omnitrophota bacterium]
MELEYIVCNLCGISREKVLFHTKIGNIVRCQICGLAYRNPRLVEKEELERYIYGGIVNRLPWEQINASKQKFFEDTLVKINRAMRPGIMLDVGCGDGFFLKLAQVSGWDVYGVEISKLLVEQARKRIGTNKIFEGVLKEGIYPLSFFNIVTFWDVLDHLSNPLATLQEVNRILKENGVILIRMRNALFHVSFSVLFGKITSWLHLKPTVFHLYSFSPRTIRNMLEKAGFREIGVENSILTSGDPYRQGRIFGPLGIEMIKRFMFAMFQVVYYLSGKRCVWSSSIIVYGRK